MQIAGDSRFFTAVQRREVTCSAVYINAVKCSAGMDKLLKKSEL